MFGSQLVLWYTLVGILLSSSGKGLAFLFPQNNILPTDRLTPHFAKSKQGKPAADTNLTNSTASLINADTSTNLLPTTDCTTSSSRNNSTKKTFIRFSQCFQRHVIFQSSLYHYEESCDSREGGGVGAAANGAIDCCNDIIMPNSPHHCHVLESFRFLDDAMTAYPLATIVPLREVALWKDEEEHNFILGGMGLTSSRTMMKSLRPPLPSSSPSSTHDDEDNENDENDDENGSKNVPAATSSTSRPPNINDIITVDNEGTTLTKNVPGIESLHYLASLALSGQKGRNVVVPVPPSLQNTREMKNLHKNAYVGELANIAQSRFASHSPESIRFNYNHVMDLFTRCRNPKIVSPSTTDQVVSSSRSSSSSDSNWMFEMTRSGLSLTQSEARALIAEFPQMCLYESHELVERIKFMIAPLSPLIEQEESCSFLRSGEDLDVDCKC